MKTNYCKDALVKQMRIKGTEVDAFKAVIQVAAFLSKERAEEFKYYLIKKGENAEIGFPIIRVIHPAHSLTKSTTKSFKSIAKAEQLTPEQVKKLKAITNLSSQRDEIIVPTYVPTGFKPYIFQHPSSESYTIMYWNASNACFSISIPLTTDSSGEGLGNVIKINSLALGKVNLQYTDFVQTSNKSISGFLLDAIYPDGRHYSYQFSTPPVRVDIPEKSSEQFKGCSNVSLSEAVKIVESLQFLDPSNSRNVHFISH